MKRRSRYWLGAIALLAAAAAGAILANFALLDAAAGDEPVGKLSPLIALTRTVGETDTGTVDFPTVTDMARTEPVESPSETGATTVPADDRSDDAHSGEDDRDPDHGADDRDD